MTKVSIIMPLYNAEKYLTEAIKSILNQTYNDFELICINDCSTDRTRDIVEEFQKRDDRIKMLKNEKNLGAAPSRNKGLKAARGDYILFLDGDDIFEEELLEKATATIEKYQADIVLFEYMHVLSEAIYTKKVMERPKEFYERYCVTPFSMNDFKPREFPWWASSPCNRMLRRLFLEENRLEFQNLASSNDVYFAQMCLYCAKKIICLDDRRVMVYARDHSEPLRISNQRNSMCSYYAMEKVCLELKERGMIGKYAPYLYFKLPAYFMYVLTAEKDEDRKKSLYDFLHEEGIFRCVNCGKEYYEQIDEYDKYLLENFQNKTYESGWYNHLDAYFQVHLERNGDIISEFINGLILENKKIILWGIGNDGKILLEYLTANSIKIFGIVDRSEKKQGTFVCGYEILRPDSYGMEVDYILVTSKWVYQEVSIEAKDMGSIVVNLWEMLTERKTHS